MNQCLVCSAPSIYTYCSLSCSNRARSKKNESKYFLNPKSCKTCSSPIPYARRFSNVFCSSSCSAIFNNGERTRKPKNYRICNVCGKETTNPKYCSISCSSIPLLDKSLSNFLDGKLAYRNSIKKVLVRVRGNICQICHLSSWCGKSIVLIVDHINGNAGDNSPENLRLICPNCNSQTPTFSGRNKGNGRKSRGLSR
jgi:predicted nucleic acid-binding Zn ribbon protein